jgi:ribonucleoside-diphosphate reductase alpha chain
MQEDVNLKEHLGIIIDLSRDALLPEKGRAMMTKPGFYKIEKEESPQESFARAAACYSFGDYELAQFIYDAASKHWFTFASPVLSNAVEVEWPTFEKHEFHEASDWLEENVEPNGLPISCYLSYIPDSKEGLVESRKETAWLSMMGGGIGIHTANRSPDEKSTGVMAHLRGYDADAIAYKQTECYSKDTEVLTQRGWVRFDETLVDDLVATVTGKGTFSFEKPSRWVDYEYSGKLVNLKSNRKGLDLKVTPNHDLAIQRKRGGVWSDIEKVQAKDLKLHNKIKFLTTSDYCGGVESLSAIEQLMIAHQADGHNYKQGQQIGFHFSKERKKLRLETILNSTDIEYSLTGDETYRFYVKHNHLPKDLNWIDLGSTSPGKARAYLDEISYWDGYRKNDQITFTSINEGDVEVVQCLAVIAGYGSSSICKYASEKDNTRDIYSITVGTRSHFLAEKVEKTEVDYEGKVYCCTVSTGNIVVRAGKVPLVCGNSRRGSIGAYLNVDHPEIISFIEMRDPTSGDMNKKCFNLNNAVNITDSFMNSMIKGEDYELVDPKHGPTGRFLSAREVWEKILETRFETGEPYIHFIDTTNRNIPSWITKATYHVSQSNLCSEIVLMTSSKRTAVCCLSSLNLERYDEWKDTPLVEYLLRFLDNVLEYFIRLAPPQLARAIHSASKERATGIGTLGMHSYFQSKMIAFESGGFNSAASLCSQIYSQLKARGIAESKRLADERGEAPDCAGSGMRNSNIFAVAPNASSASIIGVSPSVEPWSSNCFNEQGRAGSHLIRNKHLEQLLEQKGYDTKEVWNRIMKDDGSVQSLEFLSEHEKKVFKTFREIDQRWVIELAAIRQEHICQSQSLNIKLGKNTTFTEMSDLHVLAWKKGVKSLYYCRAERASKASLDAPEVKQPLNKVEVDFETCLSCEG